MEFTFQLLGCGTSMGVPVPTCSCPVCTSDDPRNKRLRASAHVQAGELSILIDTGPDMRTQVLRAGIGAIQAVLYTHAHSDHINGIDDLRMFSFKNKGIDAYATDVTHAAIERTFPYIFQGRYEGGMPAMLDFHHIEGSFEIGGFPITPLPVFHGSMPVLGFRFGNVAYITDCKTIPEDTYQLLEGVEFLILDCLRVEPDHPTHMVLNEALEAISRVAPRQAWFTHMTHDMDATRPPEGLPDGVGLGYDGLTINGIA